ncbi:3-keto-L-gulonate-6-phosphate decarboxylase [Latilactobacillus sakei subsp. carnosus DSM 15831]|uniref:3-keto-L-gulonate-6-phosphate decarboxylase UlaD n=1 Tax=Latilactobacillus TaxID=2767885 RepID=UPI00019CED00|nr:MULTISPECIES: 3-keto-L-gulonate-6-phosphate decarboxylase UlaD [Latilactobacillus]ANJ68694.1 3-keto-L-gulonate-6-phosphate decarboxylase [Latilactobacillus curvatus]KHO13066.1 3-keto-L-gulonate-6-phosphate decarboxylase [Latilactobacillus curvatus]KRL71510.1 3-keto-L-gulonate-6-phosphate decarboxylase [Latilactobacillus sakei subsp. carnosus DSM 15831]MDG2981824.1 3-keto-L-gulonate-6-phosphate decarboxylase UlaD [Latilactobacillus curvatus]WHQ78020.1 3-keto-L-gulonate-6-phosphate decarboxyl
MKKPNLQIALDQNTLAEAARIAHLAGPIVDIVEVGTILELQAGQQSISVLRAMFPDKIIASDTKCADAGSTVAQNSKDAGADLMTVIDSATIATMKSAKSVLDGIQVELYTAWTWELAQQWQAIGIEQVIYHQSRDALLAGEVWGKKDLDIVKKFIDMGFKVSVTGGLNLDTIKLFEGVPVYTFIAGRAITGQADPAAAAEAFQAEIRKYWS